MNLKVVTAPASADFISGALLLIDKPQGWTSFDVVNKVRGLIRHKFKIKKIKVGHSGTLDPMATGLLLICTGSWTKELHHLTGLDKRYIGKITLGIETDSYDAEGKTVSTTDVPPLTEDDIKKHLDSFIGDIEQFPPAFSAIKKDGVPLYEMARAGKEVKTEARKVKVFAIQFISYKPPVIEIMVHCGSGFYVRSLAHDLGAKIGCGAHLSGLVRTSVGTYSLDDAFNLDEIKNALT
ncbi:MAG: tRNA pseudouridine(55) synthase TruB [Saprospiraceae bacterium]|nr:tRNA pseudouridine(55) synthase TruB [Saprospiraceae bacterium]